ncbi:MAG: SDR family oxidoreductase [Thaumarchaeota archaeon]|nr:SDR family oxidoreductase [Nitrososphaerota archaeon]
MTDVSTPAAESDDRVDEHPAQPNGQKTNRNVAKLGVAKWKTALITGASSGIGYELAKLFASEGHSVMLVARSKETLEKFARQLRETHSINAWSFPIDLSNPTAPSQIYEFAQRESLLVDSLVNDAGFGAAGPFSETDVKTQLEMMQVNVISLVHLTRLFLPDMLQRKEGRILNLASMAAFVPGPFMAVYYATKVFVLSFSEALANELKGSGVTVTALCPGPTRTAFEKNPGVGRTRLFRQRGVGVMGAEAVALAGYRGLMNGETVVIPGLKNKVTRVLAKLAPRSVAVRAARRLNESAV